METETASPKPTMRHDRLEEILDRDPRFAPEAYEFMFDALSFVQRKLTRQARAGADAANSRHVAARELVEGAKELAIRDFGYLAPVVFRLWGLHTTDDLGAVVYNLIAAGEMSQAEDDRPEDFNGLFDLQAALKQEFVLTLDEE